MNTEFDFIDLYLLIQETKKINFSSEKTINKLYDKYLSNCKKIGKLNKKSLKKFLKEDNYYNRSEILDHLPSGYKTLVIKKKIYNSDLQCDKKINKGQQLKNLPNWNKLQNRSIYHKSHIIARELGGERIYHSSGEYYNGFIGTEHANVGRNGKSGMRYIERVIRKHLCKNENNYIVYECRVIYKRPKDIIPIFIVIIIISGDYSINKIYFVWNTQEGYIIDYKTGNYLPYDKKIQT